MDLVVNSLLHALLYSGVALVTAGIFIVFVVITDHPASEPSQPQEPDDVALSLYGQTCLIDPETREPVSFLCQHEQRDI